MKKSTMLSGFFLTSTSAFTVNTVSATSQNKIDEKRNVKQPPELHLAQVVLKNFIPILTKLYQKAFLYRQYSRDHHLYSPVPI